MKNKYLLIAFLLLSSTPVISGKITPENDNEQNQKNEQFASQNTPLDPQLQQTPFLIQQQPILRPPQSPSMHAMKNRAHQRQKEDHLEYFQKQRNWQAEKKPSFFNLNTWNNMGTQLPFLLNILPIQNDRQKSLLNQNMANYRDLIRKEQLKQKFDTKRPQFNTQQAQFQQPIMQEPQLIIPEEINLQPVNPQPIEQENQNNDTHSAGGRVFNHWE